MSFLEDQLRAAAQRGELKGMTLKQRLKAIDEEIAQLEARKETMINAEPAEFGNIELPSWVALHRYVIVLGDGSQDQHYSSYFDQRPAAFRFLRGRGGRYVLDLRKGEILDSNETILARVEIERPTPGPEDPWPTTRATVTP